MEVTATGWVLIFLGLACFHQPRWLMYLLVGSVTFSATAVINFPAVPFGMQPYHWFGLLLFVSTAVLRLPTLLRAASPATRMNTAVYAFLGWGIVATVAAGAKGTSVAHMVHLLFGASMMGCIVANTRRFADLTRTIRALVYGTLLACAWGVVELACALLGIAYPDGVFNNSVGENVGTASVLFFGIPRLSSVATEPSYLVRSLVPVLCLVMGLWLYQSRTKLTLPWLRPMGWKLALLALITVLSTSSLGIVALVLASILPLVFARRARLLIIAAYLVAGSVIVYLFTTNPLLVDLADELLFGKLEYGSGTDRITSVADAYEAFMAHPITGAGPGLITSHDLLLKLLSNFGMVGAALFLLTLFTAAMQGLRTASRHRRNPRSALCLGLLVANVMLWIMDGLAGVSYQYGIFWALLGLLISASRMPRKTVATSKKVSIDQPVVANTAGLDHYDRA